MIFKEAQRMGKELGSTLAILRKKAGLTQEQAAEKMLLKNKSTLASWECGKAFFRDFCHCPDAGKGSADCRCPSDGAIRTQEG